MSWPWLLINNPSICPRCFIGLGPQMEVFKVGKWKARTLYPYDEAIRNLLFQFKACKDIELAPIFLEYQAPLLRIIYEGYSLVPVPSFSSKDEERGFNHVEEMFKVLGLKMIHALKKTKDVKQASLSKEKRGDIKSSLALLPHVDLAGQKILLVDDLITTGDTAKACLELLESLHPRKLEVLAMGHTAIDEKKVRPKPSV